MRRCPERPGSVAPAFLDPVLAIVERIDRRLRRIEPVATGSLLGLERRHHRGKPVTLADGTEVRRGDPICTIHLDNARVREVAGRDWQTQGFRLARGDFPLVAAWHLGQPTDRRPVAYFGITLLAALAQRDGWEVRERHQTAWVRLEDWYLRSLLVRWSPEGRRRLARGRHRFQTREIWLSAAALLRRYGPPSSEAQ